MDLKRTSVVAVLLLVLAGCGANPEATKAKLLKSGNEYFEQGKYREAAILYGKAIREDRRFGEAYYRLALAEFELGRILQSIRALQRATELQPKNKDAFVRLSELYLMALVASRGHPNSALITRDLRDLVERAEKEQTDSFEVSRVRGYLALVEGKPAEAVAYFRKALVLQPDNRKLLLALTDALVRAGEGKEAEKLATEAIERDPSDGPFYDTLYLLYLKQHRTNDAERVIKQKCENNPDNINYQLQLAAHYHRLKKPAARDAVLNRLVSNRDKFPDAALRVGGFLVRTGYFDRAIQLYKEGAKADPARKETYQLETVQALIAAGRMQPALLLTEQILKQDPNNAQAKVLRGALRIQGGDPQAARETIHDFEALVAQMPQNPVLRYNFGRAYLTIGDQDKALVQFQEAANLRSDYMAPRFALAQIYMAKAQPAMAAKLAEEILAIDPASVRGRLTRADALIGLRQYHQARADIESVLRENPQQPDAQFLMASLNIAERNYKDAEAALRRLYANSPEDSRGIRGLIAVYIAQGKAKQAQRLLDTELEKNPESRSLHLVAARIAIAGKDYKRAISEYTRVLEQDPNAVDVHIALGTAYYGAGDLEKAESHYRKAIELQPKNITANLRLAMLLGEMDKPEETKKILNAILALAPDNPVALNNMAYLLAGSSSSLDTALTLAQRAIGRAPGNPTIMDTLGWIYLKKNLSGSRPGATIWPWPCSRKATSRRRGGNCARRSATTRRKPRRRRLGTFSASLAGEGDSAVYLR